MCIYFWYLACNAYLVPNYTLICSYNKVNEIEFVYVKIQQAELRTNQFLWPIDNLLNEKSLLKKDGYL